MASFPFDNSYARLPDRFFTRVAPTAVSSPRLIRVNTPLAQELGLDPTWLASEDGVRVLAGNSVPDNAASIAMAYAGHQFGGFVPQLGDGRAILLGEIVGHDGVRRDIQLKGPGRTPFSRGGDGRAALGPVLREYVVSEAMHALGIPTTRSLAAVLTGDRVVREAGMLPGAVLTRVATSHIRVGTFEFFASRRDTEGVRALADHVIARHYPDAARAEQPYRALLDAVIRAQSDLIAKWLHVGFIHGVMNTDNMSVSGETIDYGPCAFLDEYDPGMTFSSIDRHGRYAYGRQPAIGEWNLTQLASCLLPVLAADPETATAMANEALDAFAPAIQQAYDTGMRRKVGLLVPRAGDAELVGALLAAMAPNMADFTLTFRGLGEWAGQEGADAERAAVRGLFADGSAFDVWVTRWTQRLSEEPMDPAVRRAAMLAVNPAFIPRNHRIEAVIRSATEQDDFAPFEELLAVLARPFEAQPEFARYMEPPLAHERVRATFCGT